MLALQLVIGVGIALLFPLLIRTGVAAVKAPPKLQNPTHLRVGNTEEDKQFNRDQINRERQALQTANVAYAGTLFAVMAPAGLIAVIAGYLIGINAIGIGLLGGGILCSVWGYAGHWKALSPRLRFVSTLGGLLILLYIGFRYLGVS